MKKKMLILCSLITLLLATFQFPLYADENPTDPPSVTPIPNSIRLDSYFYENYDLLPYIISNGNQYINTGIKPSTDLEYSFTIRDLDLSNDPILFGSYASNNGYQVNVNHTNELVYFNFGVESKNVSVNINRPSLLYTISYSNNKFSVNGVSTEFIDPENFSNNLDLYLFNRNPFNSGRSADCNLVSMTLYDSVNNEYLRYYYPAKSKASGTVGLYDAVSDSFYASLGSEQFISPVVDSDLNLNIGQFLTASLGWIGDILEFAVETPIILIFMAIGLAGVMFRWGRRLIHF